MYQRHLYHIISDAFTEIHYIRQRCNRGLCDLEQRAINIYKYFYYFIILINNYK